MHEQSKQKSQQSSVVYQPPSKKQLDGYVIAVCERLAQQSKDDYFKEAEFVGGFSRFMTVLTRAKAKHLTSLNRTQHEEKT